MFEFPALFLTVAFENSGRDARGRTDATKQDSVRVETSSKDDVFEPIGAGLPHLLGDQPPREPPAVRALCLPLLGRAVPWWVKFFCKSLLDYEAFFYS